MTAALDAADALDRTLGWLLGAEERAASARYLEANLGRCLARGLDGVDGDAASTLSSLRDGLAGLDAAPPPERLSRLSTLRDAVSALRGRLGAPAPVAEPRGRLLPESVVAELPPRRPPLTEAPPAEAPAAAEAPAEGRPGEREPREARERRDGERRDGGRREGDRREGDRREGEARDGERREGDRREGDRRDRRERRDRDERGERREKGERGERRDRDDRRERDDRPADRRDRDDRRDRRERPEGEPAAEAPEAEAPRPAPETPRPPPEPEIRTWPLGHPEDTGKPVGTLGVFDDEELAALAEVGVEQVADLLLRPPLGHARAGERLIPDVPPEGPVIVRGVVRRRCTRFADGARWYELRVETERHSVLCRWYRGPADAPALPLAAEVLALRAGEEVGLAGRHERVEDVEPTPPPGADEGAAPAADEVRAAPVGQARAVDTVYEAEILGIDGRGGDWLPWYGVAGVAEVRMRAGVRQALRRHADTLQEHLPVEVVDRHRLPPLPQALRDVHFPANHHRKGRGRLVFDELLQVQLGVALLRARQGRERGVANPVTHGLLSRALALAGWSLTDAQEEAFDEIRRDLRRNQPMARLLQGDAGSGKQLVVQATMLVVCESEHQVLYLAPDALCAEHRFLFARDFFKAAGIEAVLLGPNPTRTQLEAVKKGEARVVYGTAALLGSPPGFKKLGLVVLEEQGTYGAVDISALDAENGQRPDLLVITPTPVASALALTVYGHLALTRIPGAPGRRVETKVFNADQRAEAYEIAKAALAGQQQVILAFPMMEDGQDLIPLSEARRLAEVLVRDFFPGAKAGIFSGSMSREERFRAYDDFAHRRTDLLLATSALEHGPPVPNAPVMLVEHAQSFDLVRLHRLRAHVANGWRPGQCLLILGEAPTDEGRATIELLQREQDGYDVAELDLARRGLSGVLGDDAIDAPGFSWADPVADRDWMLKSRQEAVKLLTLDPGLKRRVHRALLHLVRSRFGEDAFPDANAEGPATPAAGARRKRRRRR